jgi:hypothetical protein
VENRFQWRTKTDVVKHLADAGCADLIRLTTSCASHRTTSNEQPHCGRCSQCIDRRFAVLAAGQEDADPANEYEIDLLTGERSEGHPRTMLAVYVEMARQITRMQSIQFFGRYGEAGRVLRHVDGSPEEVAQRVFNLYQRHSREVMKVVENGISRLAQAIAWGSLPPSCLIRLVCDASGAGSSEPPVTSPRPDNLFRRKGEAWEVRFAGGRDFILPPHKGVAYLHILLAHPGVSLSAIELAYRVARDPNVYALGDAGESVDAAALSAYRARYEDLTELLEGARRNDDLGSQERFRREMGTLLEEINRHQGLGGRTRRAGSDRDRVRKAVGNAVRRAIEVIARYDEHLARHLDHPHLSCGHDLRYDPGPEICWEK